MKYKLIVFVVCVFHSFIPHSDSANILYYLGASSYSQQSYVMPFLETLASAGHNVTIFSPHPMKSEARGVTQFLTSKSQEFLTFFESMNFFYFRLQNRQRETWAGLGEGGVVYCHLWLTDPVTIQWVESSQFDLTIIDAGENECALGLAYKLKTPHIIFATTPNNMWHYDAFGIPAESSWIPDMEFAFPMEMSFLQRAWTTLRVIYWHFYRRIVHFSPMEEILRQYLNIPDMPSLDELQRSPSLVLINQHYSVDYSKSLPPLFVPVSGIHVIDRKVKPLPQEMKKFLKNCGKQGFIYFSFGTVAQIHTLPEYLQAVFFQTFEKFPDICFLVKWVGHPPKNAGKNLYFQEWMPQQDILAHPKIRAFITHGGFLGIQEAVYCNVPMIVFPIFADQDYNAEKVIRVGYGIGLELTTLKENELEFAIREILTNSKYKEKMSHVSALFRDRPDKPLETALWWTEFVLRHRNASSMLVPYAAKQTWYQRRLLDVWALVAITLLLLLFTTWKLTHRLFNLFFKILYPNANLKNQESRIQKKKN